MEIVNPIREKKQIEAIKKSLTGRNRLMFILGINSGLRISDILQMRIGDVRGKSTYTLREEKTGKSKTFEFNESILREVAQLDGPDDEYLFKSRQGGNRPITRVQAYRILNEAAKRAGIDEAIGTHTLRKTFGYHAYKAGVDLSLLQSIFNHSSQAVTLRYIGITQDNVNSVYRAINL